MIGVDFRKIGSVKKKVCSGLFMEGEGQYEEYNPGKAWRTAFNKQNLPDPQSRTKQIIPKDRLVQKKGRYFTTDTSDQQRRKELKDQKDREMKLAAPFASDLEEPLPVKKQQFVGKNA